MLQRLCWCAVGLALLPAVARADVAPAPPLFARIVTTDTILVGRVTAVEDKDVEVTLTPGAKTKVTMRVAVVAVADAIKSPRKLDKSIRIAFFPASKYAPKPKTGEEGLFFLSGVAPEGVHLLTGIWDYKPGAAEKETAEARRLAKLLANARESLQSRDQGERFLTAAMLVVGYRNRAGGGKFTSEPIDAEESKRILAALAEADWTKPSEVGTPAPLMVFGMLGLTKADGWVPPQVINNPDDFANAAREWLKNNAGTYRIQRLVPEKTK
jgi:hypothetical protein